MSISRRGIVTAGAVALAASLGLAGCSSGSSLAPSSSAAAPATSASGSGGSVVVGSANFPENEILAYIYGGALANAGVTVSYKVPAGARQAYFPSLEKGEINLVPEYAGAALSYLSKTANAKSGNAVKTALTDAAAKQNLSVLDLSQAADSDSLNVTPSFASKHKLTSIADLAKAGTVTLAANPEFSSRPDGIKGLQSVYGLKNLKFKAIGDGGGPATLKALLNGDVQVADIYSTTPSILASKLVTLKDPKSLFASQQVVPIVTKSKATANVTAVLNKVSAALTTKVLLQLNTQSNSAAKPDPQTVAQQWLKANNLG